MKTIKSILIVVFCTCFLACSKSDDDSNSHLKTGQIELKVTPDSKNTVSFEATAKKVTINWGDGNIDERITGGVNTFFSHIYNDQNFKTILINTEELIYLSDNPYPKSDDNFFKTGILHELRIGDCPDLKNLKCTGRQGDIGITLLTIGKCESLEVIRCNYNHLGSLDISKCPALNYLNCTDDQLTSLNVSKNKALRTIWCPLNILSASALNSLFEGLSTISEENASIYISGNPGQSSCDYTIATNKGWTVSPAPPTNPIITYPNENIVMDNAQAALYFHTIFREAENAWGFVDSKNWVSGVYEDKVGTATKKLTYEENGKTVKIEYNAWVVANQLLIGTIYFTVEKNVYRPQNTAITASITVNLTNFSINQQSVTGSSKIQYKYIADTKNDHYTYTLLDGSAIYEAGVNMPVIITGSISNGQYERTKGSATYTQKDDEWTYSGTMTGMIHDDPNLKYTNTIQTSAVSINKVEYAAPVVFTLDCKTAKQGAANIVISGHPNILYGYNCDDIDFESVTNVN